MEVAFSCLNVDINTRTLGGEAARGIVADNISAGNQEADGETGSCVVASTNGQKRTRGKRGGRQISSNGHEKLAHQKRRDDFKVDHPV